MDNAFLVQQIVLHALIQIPAQVAVLIIIWTMVFVFQTLFHVVLQKVVKPASMTSNAKPAILDTIFNLVDIVNNARIVVHNVLPQLCVQFVMQDITTILEPVAIVKLTVYYVQMLTHVLNAQSDLL
jgi:hypothetical protein